MNIKAQVYETLTPRQQVIAGIEASARDDDEELQRLKETCPKFNYKMTDPTYSMTMLLLMSTSVSIETDIRGSLIYFLLAILARKTDMAFEAAQDIANIQSGWHEFLETMGIDPAIMAKAGLPPHPLRKLFDKFIPEPDPEESASHCEDLVKFFQAIAED